MSKRIKLEPLQTILDKPFRIQDVDNMPEDGGEPVRVENANVMHVVKLLILNIPPALITAQGVTQMVTMQDAVNAKDFLDQAKESKDGVLVVSEGIYDWVKEKIEKYAPVQFGMNAKAIKDGWENLVKRDDKVKE